MRINTGTRTAVRPAVPSQTEVSWVLLWLLLFFSFLLFSKVRLWTLRCLEKLANVRRGCCDL